MCTLWSCPDLFLEKYVGNGIRYRQIIGKYWKIIKFFKEKLNGSVFLKKR